MPEKTKNHRRRFGLQEFLSLREVGEILRVSGRTVHEFTRTEHDPLPFFVFGQKIIRIRLTDFAKWVARRRINLEARRAVELATQSVGTFELSHEGERR